MIARAAPPARPAPPSTPGLVGNRRPQPHRIYLSTGRVLEGYLHRSPGTRLADHLATLKGFLSVTDATCTSSGDRLEHAVLNMDHILFIEEMVAEAAGAAVGVGTIPS